MDLITGVTKNWNRLSVADKGIRLFFIINTLAVLTLLKFVIFGK